MSLKTPVVSVPVQNNVSSPTSLFHIQFGYDDTLQISTIVAVADKMNWTSAVYVGNTHTGKHFKYKIIKIVKLYSYIYYLQIRLSTVYCVDEDHLLY